jgi:hypothetical protein
VAVLLVAIVAINYIPNQYVDRFESIITGEEKEGRSADARLEILEDSVAIFIEHPFGVGISAFPAARAAKFGRSQDTHNLYFEVATNLGIQGLIIFLLLIAKMALLLKKTEMKFTVQLEKLDKKVEPGSLIMNSSVVEHRNELRFLKATTSATLAYLVIRLVLGLFGHDLYEIYWWVVLGLAVAISRCNFVATKRTHQICLSAVH